jgi:hypothetical protein
MSVGDASSVAGDHDLDGIDVETAEVIDQVARLQARARYEPHNVHLGKAGGLNFGLQVSLAAQSSNLISSHPISSHRIARHP